MTPMIAGVCKIVFRCFERLCSCGVRNGPMQINEYVMAGQYTLGQANVKSLRALPATSIMARFIAVFVVLFIIKPEQHRGAVPAS